MAGIQRPTSERLRRCALDLFAARGYDDVTVEEIARAAGVSHMTFFRHFPSKADVVLDDPYDPAMAAAVAAQPPGLPALVRVVRGLRVVWDQIEVPAGTDLRLRLALAGGHPALRAEALRSNDRTADAIADALERTGTGRLAARTAAAAVLAALTVALFEWAQDGPPADGPGATIRGALDVLDPEVRS
ncbi:TetR/AcrR family transcriptional regulator [Oerskovia flava]|uniref:TetR/AcrR family transcriptional regulator n=1 Tax=Oerskovia flava TaxID=2986422 RepID=UPI00223F2E3A|nr:TetR/AcrR family transcriptional regulator [Oerskovia sp. JB1-3-2]